jgi:hypothetical protein
MDKKVLPFFAQVELGVIEIYNEFSLQHELGIFLRKAFPDYKVQFERPVDHFGLKRNNFDKKEIDIAIFKENEKPYMAIELKFPRQGQHPEQMFSACTDILFLEQLVEAKFSNGLFIMVVDDDLFIRGRDTTGIYQYFRTNKPINGTITKPTGRDKWEICIKNKYYVKWNQLKNDYNYCCVKI